MSKGKSLRREFEEAARRAAEAGFPGAGRLFGMTPAEMEWELLAFAARKRLEMERLDDLAWLVGRYAAIGVNAPKKYPRKPDGVKRAARKMDAGEMKDVFVKMAREEDGARQ